MTNPIYWYLDEAGRNSPSLEITEILHPEELSRWKEMRIPKRQQEWQHGRLTAKSLLTAAGMPYQGFPFSQIHIANHPEGAPFIAAPKNFGNLSISHRENLAVSAYTHSKLINIGIDLEKIEAREWSFIEDFFTSQEAAHVGTLPKSLRALWVTIVWSAKEAVLKAWQKGLRLDTRRVEILPASFEGTQTKENIWMPLGFISHASGFPDCWLFWQQRENYILTLASTKNTGDPIGESPEGPPNIQLVFPEK